MAVRYRSLADGDGIAFKWESSLNKILTAGNYAVEIEHYGADVGLPIEDCGTKHSIVGTLVVTDSGALDNKQGDRVMGQVLTFTQRESKETSIYTRTYAGGEWGEWCSLARTSMYENISNPDELYASVAELVTQTQEINACLAAETKRATETDNNLQESIAEYDGAIDRLANAVGEPMSTKILSSNEYSGFVYNGAKWVSVAASGVYDSFVIPLNAGVHISFQSSIDTYISSSFSLTDEPKAGEVAYISKYIVSRLKQGFVPQPEERYLVVNIQKALYIENDLSYTLQASGMYASVAAETARAKAVEAVLQSSIMPLVGKTILCLGDSITEFSYDGKRYSDYLAEITGATVYNGGIGGTGISRRSDIPADGAFTSNAQAYACLDLPSIAESLNSGDFSLPQAAAEWLVSDDNPNKTADDNRAVVEVLKNVDLSSVDIVTIFIGTNDIGKQLGELGESIKVTDAAPYPYANVSRGFNRVISQLLLKNPNLRIYYFSPMPRYWGDIRTFDSGSADADSNWCDNYTVSAGYSFPDLVDHLISLARYYKIPVCDMYRTLGINQWNIASIMRGDISDGTHPYKGFKMIANKIASFIIANNNLNECAVQ